MKKMNSQVKSFNTAIARSKPSAPLMKILSSYFKVSDDMTSYKFLDYGCGRGFDSDFLIKKGFNVDSYDPYWRPETLKSGSYDYIFCTYVLNVLEAEDSIEVINNIRSLLDKNGVAFLSVRRDVKKDGETSRGFQRNVILDLDKLCDYKNSYCIYLLRGNDERRTR